MKLKKILAVALAATTALSSGVAYDMFGVGAGTAEADEIRKAVMQGHLPV